MAILTRVINGSFTEIYIGGGNWITQSAPTFRHQFWKRKILAPSESVEDFRQVTDAEKAALEKADADFEEPTEELLRQWDAIMFTQDGGRNEKKVVGGYDPTDGYFHLGSQVFTTKEVREAFAEVSYPRSSMTMYNKDKWWMKLGVLRGSSYGTDIGSAFAYCRNMRAALVDGYFKRLSATVISHAFVGCKLLEEILGVIDVSQITGSPQYFYWTFKDCTALREVRLMNVKCDPALNHCPNLSLESIWYAIYYAANTDRITITLHPDAYARVTEEIFALAESKNITLATT